MDKAAALRELAKRRQACKLEGYTKPYNQIGDYHRGVYECDHVSPYTKSACNLDANVMVFLQDWSCDESLRGPVKPERISLGYTPTKRTNVTLIEHLGHHLELRLSDTYATNLFPFIKRGSANAAIPRRDLELAAYEYGLPQLTIVRPKIAVCLGLSTFKALRAACGQDKVQRIAEAIAAPFCHEETVVFCQAHTSQQGQNTRNRLDKRQVHKDWSKMALCYRNMPADRAETCTWFPEWWVMQAG